jgi:hypothetical protein
MFFSESVVKTASNLGGGYVNAGSETNEQLLFGSVFRIKS